MTRAPHGTGFMIATLAGIAIWLVVLASYLILGGSIHPVGWNPALSVSYTPIRSYRGAEPGSSSDSAWPTISAANGRCPPAMPAL